MRVDEKIAFLDQYLGISQKWNNIWSQLPWVSKRKSSVFYCNMSPSQSHFCRLEQMYCALHMVADASGFTIWTDCCRYDLCPCIWTA